MRKLSSTVLQSKCRSAVQIKCYPKQHEGCFSAPPHFSKLENSPDCHDHALQMSYVRHVCWRYQNTRYKSTRRFECQLARQSLIEFGICIFRCRIFFIFLAFLTEAHNDIKIIKNILFFFFCPVSNIWKLCVHACTWKSVLGFCFMYTVFYMIHTPLFRALPFTFLSMGGDEGGSAVWRKWCNCPS